MHSGPPCQAVTVSGRPCRGRAGPSGRCVFHRPGYTQPPRNGGHKRKADLVERRREVIALHGQGLSAEEIGDRLGVSEYTARADIRALRKTGAIRRKRYRRTPGQLAYAARRRAQGAEVARKVAALYEMGVPRKEIASLVGRTWQTVEFHCSRLRKEGRIGRRYEPIELDDATGREVARLWRKGATAGEIAERFGWSEIRTRSVIFRLRANGFDLPGRFRPKEELAALIEMQEREQRSGNRAWRESGHWTAASVDAPLNAEGFTILDTLPDENDALAEMGQPA